MGYRVNVVGATQILDFVTIQHGPIVAPIVQMEHLAAVMGNATGFVATVRQSVRIFSYSQAFFINNDFDLKNIKYIRSEANK